MSGGSFDYLYCKEAGDLLQDEGTLKEMADELARLGYAADAALETQALLLEIRAARNRIASSIDRLSPVWRGLEWWKSCDTDEGGFEKALSTYRGEVQG